VQSSLSKIHFGFRFLYKKPQFRVHLLKNSANRQFLSTLPLHYNTSLLKQKNYT